MEVTKWLKPSISVSRIGDSASVQAATRVNAEQASKMSMCRPTRRPFRGRLTRLGEMSEEYAQPLHRGSGKRRRSSARSMRILRVSRRWYSLSAGGFARRRFGAGRLRLALGRIGRGELPRLDNDGAQFVKILAAVVEGYQPLRNIFYRARPYCCAYPQRRRWMHPV